MKPDILSTDMTTLGASVTLGRPVLRKACVIRADLGPSGEFATTQGMVRAMFPIAGGEARGDGWSARIVPGGADFAFCLPDGIYAIEARYCLQLSTDVRDHRAPLFACDVEEARQSGGPRERTYHPRSGIPGRMNRY